MIFILFYWSLLNCVPCVIRWQCALLAYGLTCRGALRMCSRANVLCVLSCSCASVLECLRASCLNMPCMLMYLCAQVVCMLMCSSDNMPWVPCLTQLDWRRDHLPTCLSSVSSLMLLFSISLPLLVKLHTMLARFKSLMKVFLSNVNSYIIQVVNFM